MGINDRSELCGFCKSNSQCSTRCGCNEFQLDEEKFKAIQENWWNITVAMPLRRALRLDQEEDDNMNITDYISTSRPEVETLANYDAIVQHTNSSVKSEHPIISNLKTGDIINAITIRHGHIDGEMVIETYTDKEFTVYHNGLKIGLTFTPEMLPEITFHNGERERLFKCELVPSVHPKFKSDTLVQLIRDPEADFKDTEEDITGLCYIAEYVDSLVEGFSMTQIQKKVTNIENRPFTLRISTRVFSLAELNKYLFKVIDVDFGKIRD